MFGVIYNSTYKSALYTVAVLIKLALQHRRLKIINWRTAENSFRGEVVACSGRRRRSTRRGVASETPIVASARSSWTRNVSRFHFIRRRSSLPCDSPGDIVCVMSVRRPWRERKSKKKQKQKKNRGDYANRWSKSFRKSIESSSMSTIVSILSHFSSIPHMCITSCPDCFTHVLGFRCVVARVSANIKARVITTWAGEHAGCTSVHSVTRLCNRWCHLHTSTICSRLRLSFVSQI